MFGALMLSGLFIWQIERADHHHQSQDAERSAATTTANNSANIASGIRLPDAPPIEPLTAPATATIKPPSQLTIHAATDRLGPLTSAQLEWLAGHGYQDLPDSTDIADIDLQHLHAEAVSGATVAIHRYAAVAAIRGNADAISWLHRSAALGSTQALLRIAAWHSRRDTTTQATDSAIAWLLVAQRRGDPFTKDMMASISDRSITPEIEQLAETLYQELESDRYRHGLPAFDNQNFPTNRNSPTP